MMVNTKDEVHGKDDHYDDDDDNAIYIFYPALFETLDARKR